VSLGDFVVVQTCTYTNPDGIAYYTPTLLCYSLLLLRYKPVQHVTVLNTVGNCNTLYYNIILLSYGTTIVHVVCHQPKHRNGVHTCMVITRLVTRNKISTQFHSSGQPDDDHIWLKLVADLNQIYAALNYTCIWLHI
jgi:hypothetical protein